MKSPFVTLNCHEEKAPWNPIEIPLKSHWNPIEIQLKSHWNPITFPLITRLSQAPQRPRGHLRPGPRRQSRGALRPRPCGAGGGRHRGRKRCGAAERGADGADLRGLENAEGEGDLEICYGHLLVITGYFHGIIHSINIHKWGFVSTYNL